MCAQGETPETNEVINFMKSHELFTINTKFRKKQSPATYLHVVAQGSTPGNDQYVGREVKTQWQGHDYLCKVVKNYRKPGADHHGECHVVEVHGNMIEHDVHE